MAQFLLSWRVLLIILLLTLKISAIKVPLFNLVEIPASLCIPITFMDFISSPNSIIGLPDGPLLVGIVWENSLLSISLIFPFAYTGPFPKGYSIENISVFLYISYPFL